MKQAYNINSNEYSAMLRAWVVLLQNKNCPADIKSDINNWLIWRKEYIDECTKQLGYRPVLSDMIRFNEIKYLLRD